MQTSIHLPLALENRQFFRIRSRIRQIAGFVNHVPCWFTPVGKVGHDAPSTSPVIPALSCSPIIPSVRNLR
jgi:hypothetical protein